MRRCMQLMGCGVDSYSICFSSPQLHPFSPDQNSLVQRILALLTSAGHVLLSLSLLLKDCDAVIPDSRWKCGNHSAELCLAPVDGCGWRWWCVTTRRAAMLHKYKLLTVSRHRSRTFARISQREQPQQNEMVRGRKSAVEIRAGSCGGCQPHLKVVHIALLHKSAFARASHHLHDHASTSSFRSTAIPSGCFSTRAVVSAQPPLLQACRSSSAPVFRMRWSTVWRTSRLLSHCPSCARPIVRPLFSFPLPTASRRCLIPSSSSSSPPSRSLSSFNASLDEWQRYNSAGLSYLSSGQLEQAEQMFVAALRSSQHLLKQNQQHNSVPLYLALSNLSTAQRLQGKTGESKSNAQQALDQVRGMRKEIGVETVGHMHRELGLACEAREEWQQARQNYVEAEKCYAEKIQQLQRNSAAHPSAASTSSSPSPSPSQPSSSPSEPASAASSPSDLPSLLREHSGCLFAVGVASERLNDLHAAIEHYMAALEQAKRAWGEGTVNVAEVHVAAGKALLERGRRESDEQLSEAGREQLMEALTIYQQRQDKKLLEVLPVYLSSLQAVENLSEMMKQDEEAGRSERKPN